MSSRAAEGRACPRLRRAHRLPGDWRLCRSGMSIFACTLMWSMTSIFARGVARRAGYLNAEWSVELKNTSRHWERSASGSRCGALATKSSPIAKIS